MAILLDGKATSAKLQEEIRDRVRAHFSPENAPRLCVILVGDNPASASYVRTKCKMAEKLGFRHEVFHFDANVDRRAVEAQIDACNDDPECDAVFVQLPLPKHLDAVALPNRVRPDKDADGLTRAAMGALLLGETNAFQPCTPRGIVRLLQAYDINPQGLEAVRSHRAQQHRRQADKPHASASECDGYHVSYANARFAMARIACRFARRCGRIAGTRQGRLDKAGRRRRRLRFYQNRRRRHSRRRRFRTGGGARFAYHAGSGRRRSDDRHHAHGTNTGKRHCAPRRITPPEQKKSAAYARKAARRAG